MFIKLWNYLFAIFKTKWGISQMHSILNRNYEHSVKVRWLIVTSSALQSVKLSIKTKRILPLASVGIVLLYE